MGKRKLWVGLALLLILTAAAGIYWAADARKPDNKKSTLETISSPVPAPSGSPAISPTPAKTEPPVPQETVDLVILGSEMEGMYLARAAADEGLKVKVLDPRDQKGGQLIQAEMQFLDETRDEQSKLLVQGRAKELFDGFRNGKIRKQTEFTTYYDKLAKDIPLESGIRVEQVETKPGIDGTEALSSLIYHTKEGEKRKINAAYWAENSDFGALASKLKTVRLPGLEKFYGQDHIEYMSTGYMMKFKNVDWNRFNTSFNALSQAEKNKKYGGGYVNESYAIGLSGMTDAYKPSNDRVFLRGLNAVNQRDGEVLINALLVYTVDPADSKSVADAMELGKKETALILDHFRKSITGWEKAELNGSPSYLYIREYNHYQTDYTLNVSDLLGAKMFYDDISIGGYPLDLQGTSANKWGMEMGRPDKYGMPLRSFLLKNYENVILTGKNVGSSALAYGSARIQPNTALAAESVGVILGQIHGSKKLRELKEADWPKLHAYLESKYQIKLTGVKGNNKLAGWTEEELRKLDSGEIIYPSYVKTRKK